MLAEFTTIWSHVQHSGRNLNKVSSVVMLYTAFRFRCSWQEEKLLGHDRFVFSNTVCRQYGIGTPHECADRITSRIDKKITLYRMR